MRVIHVKLLAGLLFGLFLLTACASPLSQGGTSQTPTPSGGGSQSGTPGGVPQTPTATVDPSNVSQLLARSHENGPQDVTYMYSEIVQSSQGRADGSGTAVFTRSPDRFLLDIQFDSYPSLSRHQIYDYTTRKITSTRNGTTSSATSHIEHYYELHNGRYLGKETVNGEAAYHVSGILHQDNLAVPTELWIRVSDLYVVKVTQHVQATGFTDDLAYTDPVFNTGATIPAP